MKKMIEMIEATKVTKEELSISTLHQELVKLYSQKNVAHYTELLKYILSLSVQLNLHLVLKYLAYDRLLRQMSVCNFKRYLNA